MKFSPKEDIRHERTVFESGNTYDSVTQNLSDELVEAFYTAGWIEIEGRDPSPDRNPGAVTLTVEKTTHG